MLTGRIPTTQRVLKKAEERPACVAKCSGAAARRSCLLKVSFAFAQASGASVVECCVRCHAGSCLRDHGRGQGGHLMPRAEGGAGGQGTGGIRASASMRTRLTFFGRDSQKGRALLLSSARSREGRSCVLGHGFLSNQLPYGHVIKGPLLGSRKLQKPVS